MGKSDKVTRRVFERDGVRYVYRFEQCDVDQVQEAKSWFNYHNSLLIDRPGSYREVVIAEADSYLSKGLCHLFWQAIIKDGKEVGLERVSPETARVFIEKLKGADFIRLEECRNDFFSRTGIKNIELLMRTAASVRLSRLAYGVTQQSSSESENSNSSGNTSSDSDSTNPEKPNDGESSS